MELMLYRELWQCEAARWETARCASNEAGKDSLLRAGGLQDRYLFAGGILSLKSVFVPFLKP